MDAESILAWMIADGRVGLPLAAMAEAGGVAQSASGVDALMRAGLVEAWEGEDGKPLLTLTQLAAERHSLTMNDDLSRWLSPGEKPFKIRLELYRIAGDGSPKVVLESDMRGITRDRTGQRGDLDWMVDDLAPDPADQVEAIEEVERAAGEIEVARRAKEIEERVGRRHPCCPEPVREKFPMPVILLTGVQAWPIADLGDWRCGVCKGLEMSPATACLNCNRSGVDHLLPRVEPPRKVRAPKPDGKLTGGTGRRKAKAGAAS